MSINKPTPRNFEVIDAMPGAGKTEFFVNLAVKQLTRQQDRILVYVAPTIQLLAETFCRIAKHSNLPQERSLLKRIHVACNHVGNQKFVNHCANKGISSRLAHCPKDPPAVSLNYLLGLVTEEEYAAAKYGERTRFAKTLRSPAQMGDIILTTHEAFVRVHNYDTTNRDFATLKKCTVIFDEARHCVIGSQEIQLEPEDRMVLNTQFNLTDPERREKQEPYFLQVVDRVEPLEKIMEFLKVPRPSLIPTAIRNLAKQFEDYSRTGRAVIYILSTQPGDGPYGIPKSRHTVFTLLRPTALFDHYNKVYLTSAFFTDSQMYHFLKQDGHTFTHLLDSKYPKGTPLYNIQQRDAKLRKSIFKRLECAVLLESSVGNNRNNYRDTLTSYLLKDGIVVPSKKHDYIRERIDPKLVLSDVAAGILDDSPVSTDAETTRLLRAYAHPPLWILIRATVQIYLDWQTRFKEKSPALLTINADNGKGYTPVWEPSNMGYLRVIRSMYASGLVVEKTSGANEYDDDSELASDEMSSFSHGLLPSWERFFKKYIHHTSPHRIFAIPRSPKLHGVNTYASLNAFVHLAALNPDPKLIFVYNKLLPDYVVDQDHSIENLVQMMYRTSLRKPDAVEPVLLVVPYQASLELLARKIGNGKQSFKVDYPPQLVTLSYRRAVDAKDRAASGRIGSRIAAQRRQKYADSDKAASKLLLNSIGRKRRKLAEKPSLQLANELAMLQAKLTELQKNFTTGGL